MYQRTKPHPKLIPICCVLWINFLSGCNIPENWNAPYWPTPQSTTEEMLALAQVSSEDIVYDLGSGDGRIVITAAAKYGARGVGIEVDPKLIRKSRQLAQQAGVSGRVRFIEQDMFEADIRQATVVTLYLWESMNDRLKSLLIEQLSPDTRIVTNTYKIPGWTPIKQQDKLYLYALPPKKPK
jgi:SAM-dependent methyltransferase